MKKTVLILFFSLCASLFPQVSQFRFRHLDAKSGLSSNTVPAIFQDSKGFLWFGTSEGLDKYNGYSIKAYTNIYGDSTSISDNLVTSICEDKSGRLWIGTLNGLNRFDRNRDKFTRFNTENNSGLKHNFIRKVLCDSYGNIWAATLKGLHLFNYKTSRFDQFTKSSTPGSISNDSVYAIHEDKYRNLWIGTASGIERFNRDSKTFTRLKPPRAGNSYGISAVDCITSDSAGNIYFNSKNNILKYSPKSGDFINLYSPSKINDIHADNSTGLTVINGKYLWNATTKGIRIFDLGSYSVSYITKDPLSPESLNDSKVRTVFQDNRGVVFIGTVEGGVNILNSIERRFSKLNKNPNERQSLINDVVMDVIADKAGIIWIGTNMGLDSYSPKTGIITHYSEENANLALNSISLLTPDPFNEDILWIASGNGIDKFSKSRKKSIKLFSKKSFNLNPKYNFQSSCFADRNTLYIGTSAGLYILDPENETIQSIALNKIGVMPVEKFNFNMIYNDSHNLLWICTSNGIIVYNRSKNSFRHYNANPLQKDSLHSETCYSIIEDREHNMWIGTREGLSKFIRGENRFVRYNTKDEELKDKIYTLEIDTDNNLWLGGFSGLSKFNPEDRRLIRYGHEDGLHEIEKYFASCVLQDSIIFMGGLRGLTFFNTRNFRLLSNPPPVYLTEFQILNKPVKIGEPINGNIKLQSSLEELKELKLDYDDYLVYFEFAALDYFDPSKNTYAIKMENLEDNWNYIGKRRIASYNLPPGNYILRIKGTNRDHVWSSNELAIPIFVAPPWYKTKLFIGFVILLSITMIYGFYKYRTFRLKKEAKLLSVKIEEKTKELLNSKKELEVMNSKLEDANQELGVVNEDLKKSNEELEKSNLQLSILNNRLELTNKELDSFSYSVSHDLRAPLRSIAGFTQIIREDYPDSLPEEVMRLLEKIASSAKRMNELIDGILKLSRLNQASLSIVDIDLSKLCTDLIDNMRHTYSSSVLYPVVQPGMNIKGDLVLITSMMENLIGNALKFSAREKEIRIEIGETIDFDKTKTKSSKVFFIKDFGVGFDMNYADKLFKLFQRLHDISEFEGTGIGLANVKKIVSRHDGTIWAESKPGKGTVFFFTLGR